MTFWPADEIPKDGGPQTVARFAIKYTRFLDPEGRMLREPLPSFATDPADLITLYRAMVLTRSFDAKAVNLQRTGKLGTYGSCLGQEAIGVGVASAMQMDDVFIPTYRETGGQLWRGVTMTEILLYWGGDERGSEFSGPQQDFPVSVPIATQTTHAVGVAYAMKLRHEKRVAVCFCGDGGTSKGDFYEALNAAAVWNLPLVFIVINNQWAISLPRSQQTAAQTLAQKAIAAGFEGEQVDGNDLIAVHYAAQQALDKARAGKGSRLIECLSYRLSDHTTADDASRYRENSEVEEQWAYEPIKRVRNYLTAQGVWSEQEEQELAAECAHKVDKAVQAYLGTPPQSPEAMFDYLYATLPSAMTKQRQAAVAAAHSETDKSDA